MECTFESVAFWVNLDFCDRTVTDKLFYTCKNAVEMERNLKFRADNIYMLRNDVYVKGTIR